MMICGGLFLFVPDLKLFQELLWRGGFSGRRQQ
jgi:ribosomal protein L18